MYSLQDFAYFVERKRGHMPIETGRAIILRAREVAQGDDKMVSDNDVDAIMGDLALTREFRAITKSESHH